MTDNQPLGSKERNNQKSPLTVMTGGRCGCPTGDFSVCSVPVSRDFSWHRQEMADE